MRDSDCNSHTAEHRQAVASELAFHVDWILYAFEPDFPSSPEAYRVVPSLDPDDIAGVVRLEDHFACVSFQGRRLGTASIDETLGIWRDHQTESVPDVRFQQVRGHVRAYMEHEQARESKRIQAPGPVRGRARPTRQPESRRLRRGRRPAPRR